MWEKLSSRPLGSLSMRKYLSVATVFLVVCFGYIFATAPLAHAADAQWSGANIVYDGQTYNSLGESKGTESHKISKGSQIYSYVEGAGSVNAGSLQKAHLIYFPSGTDPATATTAFYLTYTLNGNQYTQPSARTAITIDSTTASAGAGTPVQPETSCVVDGVGWIVCSMSNWIAEGVDYLYGILTKFFIVEPLTVSSQTNSIYALWQSVRNIANVAFVIAFLVIIYSQITNVGLSNYDIKKMIPRIIVAAMLVNTSYWICAVAVDISNILGIAIQDLLTNMRQGLGAANFDIPAWQDVTGIILSGGALAIGGLVATGGTSGGLVFLLLGALLPAIFAALIAVAILAARQALITVFIIIAPLAFVAYLLPNTEDWFNKWRKFFMTALIMFPAFSLIFGAAQLTGIIIIQNAGSDITIALLGLTVQVVPLFITPFLIRLSTGILGTVAGIANDRSKGLFDRSKNWASTSREMYRQKGFASPKRTGLGRIRPTNMARGLNNRTLKREGMTAGYKEMAASRFTQTRGGAQVYNLGQDSHIQKELGENRNFEAYKSAMANGADPANRQRRYDHDQAHRAKGRGEVWDTKLNNHSERNLQEEIENNRDLRKARVESIVDAGLAESSKKIVEAKGAVALKQTIASDPTLKKRAIDTHELTKKAEAFETIVQKAAEEAWDTTSQTDSSIRKLRLTEVKAVDQAKVAEAEWNNIIEQARARGTNTTGLTVSETAIAGSLKGLQENLEKESKRQESMKLEQKSNLAELLKTDDTVRQYAGGDSLKGAGRVYAQAKKELLSDWLTDIENQRSTISEYSLNDLMKLYFEGELTDGTAATEEQKLAAQQEILQVKGNNWAVQQLKDHVSKEKGMFYDDDPDSANYGKYYYDRSKTQEITDPAEIDSRRTEQQMFVDGLKKSKNKIAHVSGTDMANMEAGIFTTSSHDAIIRDIKDAKYSPQSFLEMDPDELSRIIEIVRHEDERDAIPESARNNVLKAITDLQKDENLRSRIKGRERGLMNVIAAHLDPVDARDDIEKEAAYYANPETLERMHEGDDGAVRFETPVRAPSVYRVGKLNVYADGAGPDGTLSSRP